jgi:hypothetical protein
VLADEERLAHVGVRETVAGESRDLSLLSGELIAGFNAAFCGPFGVDHL